ncbi:Gp138 family membrane-puncturing spike protein [Clostridium saccharoperbutylacetonicum]|uniref:Gp138 family membrane-puncturing spike protein n=1 Tax=Clostridium saccharoperbutylacetonicum TaxID=36745 RepID=UPI0039E7B6EF
MADRNIREIIGTDEEFFRSFKDDAKNNIRVAMPGIIQSFDPIEQTVTVQPTIRENINNRDYTNQWVQLPLLLDVPVIFPKSGNYVLTFPIHTGDECLIIFLDMCYDAWWSNGGIQNQIEKRRHDLSDSICIPGLYSQPNRIQNYSTDSCQLRNLEGTAYIELKDNNINLVANSVKINGINFNQHTHTAPSGGGTTTVPNH